MAVLKNFLPTSLTTFWAQSNTVTGVVAGAPGSFTGGTLPSLAVLKADPEVGDAGTNKPGAAWTTGQFVNLRDGSKANWNGTAWTAGTRALMDEQPEGKSPAKGKATSAAAKPVAAGSKDDLVLPVE